MIHVHFQWALNFASDNDTLIFVCAFRHSRISTYSTPFRFLRLVTNATFSFNCSFIAVSFLAIIPLAKVCLIIFVIHHSGTRAQMSCFVAPSFCNGRTINASGTDLGGPAKRYSCTVEFICMSHSLQLKRCIV